MKFGVKFWCEIFRATFSRVWVCDGKFHVKNGAKNGQFHANFTLLGRSAEVLGGWGHRKIPDLSMHALDVDRTRMLPSDTKLLRK